MTAATYQYVDLPDASVVTTRALLAARENITDTVAARAMMCIHGGAGFGDQAGGGLVVVAECPRDDGGRGLEDELADRGGPAGLWRDTDFA
ncbi:hypothetical protein ACIQFZ_39135 [Streptomyces sp. NPDC093064]|uniref:hypothetical protein n=1 Tax=Streptomyces sp. NPDC093064 TaxID=3366020 RepID=UPI0038010E7E